WLQFPPHKMRPAQRWSHLSTKAKFNTTWSPRKSDGDSTASAFYGLDIRTLMDGLCRQSQHSGHSGVAHNIASERRDGHAYLLDQNSSYTRQPARCARLLLFDGANNECNLSPTFVADPVVGCVLPLEVCYVVGSGVLLLGIQLFNGRL